MTIRGAYIHVAVGDVLGSCRAAFHLDTAVGSLPAPLIHGRDFAVYYSGYSGALRGLREEDLTLLQDLAIALRGLNLKLYKPV